MKAHSLNQLAAAVLAQVCLFALCPWMPNAHAQTEAPTKEIVEKVMKGYWDEAASAAGPRSVMTLNSVKFGQPSKATAQEVQVEGIPEGGMVTPAIVDFTVRTYYTSETRAVQRVREARIYKDKMGDWAYKIGGPKGQDKTTTESAAP